MKKNKLISLKKNPNQKIFGAQGALQITKALQLEANNPKASSKNLRKISQTKATNADLTEFEAAVWERLTGHSLKSNSSDRTRVADIYENLSNPEMARAFQEAVFQKVLGKGKGITKSLRNKFKDTTYRRSSVSKASYRRASWCQGDAKNFKRRDCKES